MLSNGELKSSQKLVDVLYTCSICGLCFTQCFETESRKNPSKGELKGQGALLVNYTWSLLAPVDATMQRMVFEFMVSR